MHLLWARADTRFLRVEALLSLQWHPRNHILFFDTFKRGVTVFRVGTWFLSRLLDARECARSLPWLLWAWTMPYMGYGWMAERWHVLVDGQEDLDGVEELKEEEG
jgi:hypothetical protein